VHRRNTSFFRMLKPLRPEMRAAATRLPLPLLLRPSPCGAASARRPQMPQKTSAASSHVRSLALSHCVPGFPRVSHICLPIFFAFLQLKRSTPRSWLTPSSRNRAATSKAPLLQRCPSLPPSLLHPTSASAQGQKLRAGGCCRWRSRRASSTAHATFAPHRQLWLHGPQRQAVGRSSRPLQGCGNCDCPARTRGSHSLEFTAACPVQLEYGDAGLHFVFYLRVLVLFPLLPSLPPPSSRIASILPPSLHPLTCA
jgi:hypothetical protein